MTIYRYTKKEYCTRNTKMAVDNRYARGQIYTIRSYKTDKVYVGSTIQPLCKRLSGHRKKYTMYKKGTHHYVTSFDIFDIDFEGVFIELYENYPCDSKAELNRREGQVIREMNCVNKKVAGRTMAEWHQDNKERVKEQKNKKYECPCGGRYIHSNRVRHFKSINHRMFLFNQHNIFNHL